MPDESLHNRLKNLERDKHRDDERLRRVEQALVSLAILPAQFAKMADKFDNVIRMDEKMRYIYQRQDALEQDVKLMNERVSANAKELDDRVDKVNLKLAMYAGGIVVAVFAIQLAMKFVA